jgi:hypothetical protein
MTDITVKYSGVTNAMAQWGQEMAAEEAAGASGGPGNRTPARFTEIDNIRSYMFDIETKEVIHVDRLGADDVVRALEKLAEITVAGAELWMWVGGDRVTLKLSEHVKVKIMRDGAVIIKVPDYVLVADDKFVLLEASNDGWRVVAKGKEITWAGTEEYFTPFDVLKLAKEVARRVLEQTRWL